MRYRVSYGGVIEEDIESALPTPAAVRAAILSGDARVKVNYFYLGANVVVTPAPGAPA